MKTAAAAIQNVIVETTVPAHQKTTAAAIVAIIHKIKIVAAGIKIAIAETIAIAQPNIIVGVIAITKNMSATVATIVIVIMVESAIVIMMIAIVTAVITNTIAIVTTNQVKKTIKNCLQNFSMR